MVATERQKAICKVTPVCKFFRELVISSRSWRAVCKWAFAPASGYVSLRQNPLAITDFLGYFKTRLLQARPDRSYLRYTLLLSPWRRMMYIGWMHEVIDEACYYPRYKNPVRLPHQFSLTAMHFAKERAAAFYDRFCAASSTGLKNNMECVAACTILALEMKNPDSIDDVLWDWVSFFTGGGGGQNFHSFLPSSTIKSAACEIHQTLRCGSHASPALLGIAKPADKVDCACPDTPHLRLLGYRDCCICDSDIARFDDDLAASKLEDCLHSMKRYGPSATYAMCWYLFEIAQQTEVSLKFNGDVIGACCFALACHVLGFEFKHWSPHFFENRPESVATSVLEDCITDLLELLHLGQRIIKLSIKKKQQGITMKIHYVLRKYSTTKLDKVALREYREGRPVLEEEPILLE